MATRILAVDEQEDVFVAARPFLKSESFFTECASDPDAVVAGVKRFLPDLVLIDLNCSRDTSSSAEGLDLLDRLSRLSRRLKVVVLTAWGSIELAVEAMRRGAVDFVLKPLPRQQPILDRLDCRGYCRQAGAVRGDFYDLLDLEPGAPR